MRPLAEGPVGEVGLLLALQSMQQPFPTFGLPTPMWRDGGIWKETAAWFPQAVRVSFTSRALGCGPGGCVACSSPEGGHHGG